MEIKYSTKELLRKVFNKTTINLNSYEREGLRTGGRLLLKYRLLAVGLVASGLGAAIFEGSSIGVLGFAVSILLGEEGLPVGAVSGIVGAYIDNFLESTSRGGIFLFLIGIAIAMQVAKSVLLFVSEASQIYLATAMQRDAQRQVTDYVMRLSYPGISRYAAGEAGGFIDLAQGVQDLVDMVSNASRAILMLSVYFVLLFWMSIPMTAATAVIAILLWLALSRVVFLIKRLAKQVTLAKILVWRWTIEYLNAPRLLRIFNSTTDAAMMINTARDDVLLPERKAIAIEAAIKPVMEIITTVGAGGLLIIGYFLAGEGAISAIPKLFVFVLVFHRMKSQIQVFGNLRTKFARTLPKLEIVAKFLSDSKEDSMDGGKNSVSEFSENLVFENVNFCYPGAKRNALTDISFTIPIGHTVALVGESGAGKSTIADLISGLYEPTSGRILVDGHELRSLNISQWREQIGVVDQDVFLLNATVMDNIKFARPDATQKMVEAAVQAAYAQEFIAKLEEGFDTAIGDRGYGLSGGQQQRIALARALLRNPHILILDEATSALDTVSERMIQRALEDMHSSRTVIVIAHRLSTIENADEIIVLDEGHIIEQGNREELISRGGEFAAVWNLQTTNGNRSGKRF